MQTVSRLLFAEIPTVVMLLVGFVVAIFVLIQPIFGYFLPDSVSFDFGNHLALVGGALDTWRSTHALPISSDTIFPGIEYPYYLFGNAAFYIIASSTSFALQLPASLGAACALSLGLLVGQLGTYFLSRSFGVNRVYSGALGFLYATGPYLCINLLVRSAFPEFMAWETLPLIAFLGRRAMQPGAGAGSLTGLGAVLALSLYFHKLVGPHIILFEFLLILACARRSLDWAVRFVILGISIPFVSVFAWLPILRLDQDQIVTLKLGSLGVVLVKNNSLVNYLWPWAQNSLSTPDWEPQYGERFALQIGLLASIGLLYGVWWLFRSRFRPRNRELIVALIGGVIYSALVLGIGGITAKLPFPLSTIQFSYRLIGLAHFSGVLALIAGLGEAASRQTEPGPRRSKRLTEYFAAACVGVVVTASVSSYWRPPPVTTIPLASVAPYQLEDQSALYPKSTNSLLDTSGALGPDGSVSGRPFPIHLRGVIEHTRPGDPALVPESSREPTPRTIFLRGEAPASDFGRTDTTIRVRVFALQSSADPCAADTELPKGRTDTITALLALCQDRQPQSFGKRSVSLSGGAWVPTLIAEQTLNAPGSVDLRIAIPDNVFFIALECGGRIANETTEAVGNAVAASCLSVNYLGPTNQPNDTIQLPRPIPTQALLRRQFGQWTVRMTDQQPGDYLLPTFDYPFVKVTDTNGAEVPTYQFDRRPVVRYDGLPQTYSISYDLRRELAIFTAWGCSMVGLLVAARLYRRRRVQKAIPTPV